MIIKPFVIIPIPIHIYHLILIKLDWHDDDDETYELHCTHWTKCSSNVGSESETVFSAIML
jgi:hypothetical protein